VLKKAGSLRNFWRLAKGVPDGARAEMVSTIRLTKRDIEDRISAHAF
jgi:hypothetical protein